MRRKKKDRDSRPERRRNPPDEPGLLHVHDMNVTGQVTQPDGTVVTHWRCKTCPHRETT